MNKTASTPETAAALAPAKPKEKILFEIQPLLLPTILNLENLTMIGFTVIIMIAAVIFHFGLSEFIIIAALYLLIALPSFRSIFRAGSTTYVLTNQRLIIFAVGLGNKERSIPLEQIKDTRIRQSGLQRIYGAGDVVVYQRSLQRPVRLYGLKDCKRRAEQILQAAQKVQNNE